MNREWREIVFFFFSFVHLPFKVFRRVDRKHCYCVMHTTWNIRQETETICQWCPIIRRPTYRSKHDFYFGWVASFSNFCACRCMTSTCLTTFREPWDGERTFVYLSIGQQNFGSAFPFFHHHGSLCERIRHIAHCNTLPDDTSWFA